MRFARLAFNLLPLRVASGPFKGTRCFFTETGDGIVAKLAGTYERELHPIFSQLIADQPECVVNVGAAEGFYAAAFARLLPDADIYAYESRAEWRGRIKRLLAVNHVAGRCLIRGACDESNLKQLLDVLVERRLFLLMDIEGGEYSVLSDGVLPFLRNAEVVVELHDQRSTAPGDALIKAFRRTHEVDVLVATGLREPQDTASALWRLLATIFPSVRRRLNEGRVGEMRWLHASPRDGRKHAPQKDTELCQA